MLPSHLQVDGLQLSSGNRGVNNGAWGVWLKNGADILVKDLNAQARMVRDIAVQGLQPGTVIVNSECQACGGACAGILPHQAQSVNARMHMSDTVPKDTHGTEHLLRSHETAQSCLGPNLWADAMSMWGQIQLHAVARVGRSRCSCSGGCHSCLAACLV